MFSEPSERHHVPHFHAYYQENVDVFSISPVEIMTGSMPQRQPCVIEAWAELITFRRSNAAGNPARRAHRKAG
jgi:hypothetical protein